MYITCASLGGVARCNRPAAKPLLLAQALIISLICPYLALFSKHCLYNQG